MRENKWCCWAFSVSCDFSSFGSSVCGFNAGFLDFMFVNKKGRISIRCNLLFSLIHPYLLFSLELLAAFILVNNFQCCQEHQSPKPHALRSMLNRSNHSPSQTLDPVCIFFYSDPVCVVDYFSAMKEACLGLDHTQGRRRLVCKTQIKQLGWGIVLDRPLPLVNITSSAPFWFAPPHLHHYV